MQMKLGCAPLIVFLSLCINTISAQELQFSGGHSHNDYYQKRPLLDALEYKSVSIEADVFLHKESLLVGHSKIELKTDKTLESLYLRPLFERYQKGKLDSLILMIDIKREGKKVYTKLKTLLQPYEAMLTKYEAGRVKKKEVTIMLSGARPMETIRAEQSRYVFLDGRLNGSDILESPTLFPLISDNWNKHFKWRGKGEMSEQELKQLKNIVASCHEQGKIIRFWGIPKRLKKAKRYWKILRAAEVDLIVHDCPKCFYGFYL